MKKAFLLILKLVLDEKDTFEPQRRRFQNSIFMKILKRIGWLLLAIAVLAAGAATFYYQTKKPKYDQQITLDGIQQDIEVLYDDNGIPHIYAQSEADAYFALGYCHAKDRLFQMEMLRRLSQGQLSELVGKVALDVDKYFRTMSFRQHGERAIRELYSDPSDPIVQAANAYLRGINFFQTTGTLPIEFDLLGIAPRPFELLDCFCVAGYMGLSFCEAFDAEPVNSFVLEKFGESRIKDLVTGWDSLAQKIPVGKSAGEAAAAREILKLSEGMDKIREFTRSLPPFHGSNSWVIAGSRTSSGKPIFENDTHIGFGQPSVFFEAQLEFPGHSIYGNFIAGAPVPVIGHTAAGAWGLTIFENDEMDFYRETLNPADPNQVKFRDGWEQIETRDEIIKVKESTDCVLKVRRTRHGYILNDCFKMFKNSSQPIAAWWVFHQQPTQILRTFYQMSHAKNAADAEQAVSLIHAPGLNVTWADTAGNIAWWTAARLPIRPAHVRPYLILDGASGADEIEGWLPFAANPHSVNPPSGFVFSANNQPETMPGQRQVAGYYVPEDRARRIVSILGGEHRNWTAQQVRDMAIDNVNPVHPSVLREVVPFFEKFSLSENEKTAISILKNWEGQHGIEDIAPTIFYRWLYHFYKNTFGDELGEAEAMRHFLKSHTLKRSLDVLTRNDKSEWWDDVRTADRRETRAEIFEKSLHAAVADLEKQLGKNTAEWHWGKVHTLTHNHPLGVLPVVGKYFSVGPLSVPGGRETINNLDFLADSTGQCRVLFGPALRRVIDFSDRAGAMSINPTGNSGNVGSPFYKNQAEKFARGEFRHEWTRRTDVEKVKTGFLTFKTNKK